MGCFRALWPPRAASGLCGDTIIRPDTGDACLFCHASGDNGGATLRNGTIVARRYLGWNRDVGSRSWYSPSVFLSCPLLSCPILSCPVARALSYPALSCPVLRCPVLSCPVAYFLADSVVYAKPPPFISLPVNFTGQDFLPCCMLCVVWSCIDVLCCVSAARAVARSDVALY